MYHNASYILSKSKAWDVGADAAEDRRDCHEEAAGAAQDHLRIVLYHTISYHIYIYIYMYIHVYIYIYREREISVLYYIIEGGRVLLTETLLPRIARQATGPTQNHLRSWEFFAGTPLLGAPS